MSMNVLSQIREALRSAIQKSWGIDIPEIVLNQTPKIEMGELASPVCFELAKRLKKSPRAAAEELIQSVGTIPGIAKIQIAGAGYVNFHFDRAESFRDSFQKFSVEKSVKSSTGAGKAIVEHTNINPNKAAHIG